MRKSILILITLLASLVVTGCSAPASTPTQTSKEVVVSYYTIIYGTP